MSASGKVGSVDKTIGSNGISTEYVYNIQIEVRDSNGSSIVGRDVPAMSYVIDFKAGGKGVAIGKPATEDGVFDVNLNIKGRNGMPIGYFAYQYIGDINRALTSGIYLFDKSTINQPNGIKSWGYLEVVVASVSPTHNNSTNWIWQRFYSTGGHAYERLKVNNNGWTPWKGFDNYFDSRMNATFDGKFDTRFNQTMQVVNKGKIGLPYGLAADGERYGKMVNLSVSRQIITWNATAENNPASERLPDWAIPSQQQTLVLQRNVGIYVSEKPTILHLYTDGAIRWTNQTTGQHVFTGSITYFAKN